MEFLSISKIEIPETLDYNSNICRICLQKNHNLLVSLFDIQKSQDSTIASIVTYVAGVEILQNDLYPQLICNECLSRFQDAAEIKKKCIESDQQLKSNQLHPKFELKQEKDVDDYYDQNDFADGHIEDSEFTDFPKKEESDEDFLLAENKKPTKLRNQSKRKTNQLKRSKSQRTHEVVPEGNVCRNCSKSYANKYVLKVHLKHCQEFFYFCEICRETIKYKSEFDKHTKRHEDESITGRVKVEDKIQCHLCNIEFKERKDLYVHFKEHRTDGVYKCSQPNCSKIFTKARNFYFHLKNYHEPVVCICSFCGKYFNDRWQLKVHRSTHQSLEENLKFVCDYCGAGNTRKDRLLLHMKTHFKKFNKNKRPEELLCDKCSLKFKLFINLYRHQIRDHGATGNYQCHLCSEWFVQQSDLAKHMKSHNKPKIICNICSMSDFKNNRELKIHVELVHVRVTKHQCQTCFKSFKHPWHLNDHIKIHTGERNYECTVCSKGFILKPALTEHMRMHTGESPFACQICDNKRYRSSNALARHYKQNHKLTKLPKIVMSKSEDPVRSIPSQHLKDSCSIPMTSMNPFMK